MTQKNAAGLSTRKLKEVWGRISPDNWLALLQEFNPEGGWTSSGGDIKGHCPFHNESKPSFHVYTDSQHAHCYGCNAHFWNPIQFFAKLSQKSYSSAVAYLRKRFNLRISTKFAQNAQKIDDNDNLKQVLFRVMHVEFTEYLQNRTDPKITQDDASYHYMIG